MEIKVLDSEWNQLSDDERSKITETIGAFFKGAIIKAAPAGVSGVAVGAADVGSLCTAACNIVQAAAEAACQSIGNPGAKALCIAATKVAGEECRKAC